MEEEIKDGIIPPAEDPPAEPEIKDDDSDSLEGLPPEQLSKNVQKRIDKLTRKYREAERKIEEIQTTVISDKDRQIQELDRRNRELFEFVQKGKTEAPTEDPIKALQQKIKELKVQRSSAYENLEFKKAALLEDEIDDLKEQLIEYKVKAVKPSKEEKEEPRTDNAVIQLWVAEHPWFDASSKEYDPAMAGAARAYDDYLLADPKWRNVGVASRLKEVEKYVEKRFNTKSVPPPKGEPPSGPPKPNQLNDFNLTDDEKRTAMKFFGDRGEKEAYRIYAENRRV